MLRALPLLLSAILLSGGCAVKSTVKLVQATQAVDRAAERGAAEEAPYEFTLATLYLDKAREEASDAHHRLAQGLADAAADHADQAVIRMQEGGTSPAIPPEPADEPAAEEPAAEEPAAEEPAAEEPPAEEPGTDAPTESQEPDEPIEGGWTPPTEAPPEDAP